MSKVNGSIFVTEEYTYLFYLVALNKTHDWEIMEQKNI